MLVAKYFLDVDGWALLIFSVPSRDDSLLKVNTQSEGIGIVLARPFQRLSEMLRAENNVEEKIIV